MRLAAVILWLLLLIPALVALLLVPLMALLDPRRVREPVRAIDQLVNAFWFNGLGRESLSSHSWRERHKWWAKLVIWFTNKLVQGHCEDANKREQPIVDFINNKQGTKNANSSDYEAGNC